VHTGCSTHDHPFNPYASEENDVEWACFATNALQACSNCGRVRVEGEVIWRGKELCSCVSKVQSHTSHRKLHDNPTKIRAHDSTLEYLETRLGLSGLLHPLFFFNHGCRKGAQSGKHTANAESDITLSRGRINDCPRVRRVSRKRSSTLSPARVCVLFVPPTTLVVMVFSDWYDIKAPSIFEVRNVGKTLVNRSQGLSMWKPLVHTSHSHIVNLQKMQMTH
jgi:hypothetical protein